MFLTDILQLWGIVITEPGFFLPITLISLSAMGLAIIGRILDNLNTNKGR